MGVGSLNLMRSIYAACGRGTRQSKRTEGWADEIEFRDGLILSVAQFDGPPPGWDEATAIS